MPACTCSMLGASWFEVLSTQEDFELTASRNSVNKTIVFLYRFYKSQCSVLCLQTAWVWPGLSFWHKVLFDIGTVSTAEPFQKLVCQGMVLGPVQYVDPA